MMVKRCHKCGKVKDLTSGFSIEKRNRDGRRNACKTCAAVSYKIWSSKNTERIKERHEENKKRRIETTLRWQKNNPVRVKEICKKAYLRRSRTPRGKLNNCVHVIICRSLRRGSKKNRTWESLTGYTVDQLKAHLESQFKPGMSWANHGSFWQIDHEIPISAFNFERPEDSDFKRCWALKNLRPLESKKNLQKRAKLDAPFQPSLTI